MEAKYKINLAKLLSGAPLELCATVRKPTRAKRVTTFSPFDKVKYTRKPSGKLVRGFVKSASATVVYIYDSATGAKIAAPRNRVHKY